MDKFALFFLIVIFLISAYCIIQPSNEYGYQENYGNVCGNCRGRTLGQCMNCMNCGFISKGGFGKCVEGDMYGPYDSNPTYEGARWIYNDPFWTNVLVSDNIVKSATSKSILRYPKYDV